MPVYLGRGDLDLVRLAGLASQDYARIWGLSHQDLLQSAKVRHFKRGLKRFFRSRQRGFTSCDAESTP
ncbi:hypothetical protein [Phaeobacter gallaeciensis]|uniref:hypothetical protein n=1 Tax=Phaeobacter gallaeciensis TaxID=60890 RepID=UPI000BC0A75F|nr:hypothetical protein [Phaeobacter gallaeciensis]ATF17555.1 transcriptional regulator, LysR family [Phaeobacter gallaeciensis]ATF21664.1 transcriptional regulator, LysR family [Phaeobacter gallaeciensis]